MTSRGALGHWDMFDSYDQYVRSSVGQMGRAGLEEFLDWFIPEVLGNGKDEQLVREIESDCRCALEELGL